MKLSKRTNTIILWIISIGLLVSMLIAFTPTLGNLFGRGAQVEGRPELLVNGQTVSELEVAQARQNPPYNVAVEGEAAQDLQLLLTESLIDRVLVRQAARDVRVSNAEVNEAVRAFRESQEVAGASNDQRYLAIIGQAGFTDATFRDAYRQQLGIEKYQESLTEGVTVSDEEVEAFYAANQNGYLSEDRILARQIVLEDEAAADAALGRAQAGEDFAALARELSQERADRAGALGAPEGSTEPQPVGRAALPTAVAEAAFALQGPGLTEVLEADGRYYLVAVEEYIPSSIRPLEEVREEVEADALAVKQAGVLEDTFETLRANAEVELPETSTLTLADPVVARVGDTDIRGSELAQALYLNPQIQQSLTPENIQLITAFFKPDTLEQLIERELAYQGAQDLETTFLGSEGQIAQQALAYVSRDAEATDAELQQYYDANVASFTIPASAVATRVDFADEGSALAFREALLGGAEVAAAAEAQGGAVQDLGAVQPGALQEPELDTALFQTDAFEPISSGQEVSDVLVIQAPLEDAEAAATEDESAEEPVTDETAEPADAEGATDEATADEPASEPTDPATEEADAAAEAASEDAATQSTYAVLVAERSPERVLGLDEVRPQVEEAVLQGKRSELQDAWLTELRARIPVENLLAEASAPEDAATEDGAVTEEVAPTEEAAPTDAAEDAAAPDETAPADTETPAQDAPPAGEATDAEETPATE